MFPGLTQVISMLQTGLNAKGISEEDKRKTEKAIQALNEISKVNSSNDKDQNQQLETIITDLMKEINIKE